MNSILRAMGRSSLTHFLVLGGMLFYFSSSAERQIDVSRKAIAAFSKAEAKRRGVSQLNDREIDEVGARYLRDELLYREGIRLGLDSSDNLIRQRIIQKLQMIIFAEADASTVSDETLYRYYLTNREQWTAHPRIGFDHIFVSDLSRLKPSEWNLGSGSKALKGDRFIYGNHVEKGSRKKVEEWFGIEFADTVFKLPTGIWSQAIRSKHGWHIVRVRQFDQGRVLAFTEAQAEVRLHHRRFQRRQAINQYLNALMSEYEIVGDAPQGIGVFNAESGENSI